MYSGPLFALSFIIPWIPWAENSWMVGLHLIVALFIWDTLFTFVGLAICALFSELPQMIKNPYLIKSDMFACCTIQPLFFHKI
jgi:hypothetical protein